MITSKRIVPLLLYLIPFAAMAFVQSTSITLPTNDDTSGFVVESADGSTVFSAAGDGDVEVSGSLTAATFVGDGSTLSNVLPIMAVTQGDQAYYITAGMGDYKKIRSVSITVPAAGMIWVNATGYLDWESQNTDFFRGAIIASTETAGGTAFFDHLCVATDYACADSSDQYTPLAMSRVFTVNSGGTYTYEIWADNPFSTSRTRVGDICMTALYVPTGGTGAGKAVMPKETPSTEPNRNSLDGN